MWLRIKWKNIVLSPFALLSCGGASYYFSVSFDLYLSMALLDKEKDALSIEANRSSHFIYLYSFSGHKFGLSLSCHRGNCLYMYDDEPRRGRFGSL